MRPFYFCHILLFLLFSQLLNSQTSDFELIPSTQSGIKFSNTITPILETSENLFDFDYFYNGAGVGVIDINNDGLQDIYFASNQGQDKLYKNLGDFKFQDITTTAFANFETQWSTGVSIVDINQDGWLDIYVCQAGPRVSEARKNLLFINQKDDTFIESAAAIGIDDSGMSTQALFIDFDRDGDQDCFVMNESLAYGLDPITFTRLNLEQKARLYESYSHFYRNDDSVFVDMTKELGLDHATFGLGIRSFDVNQDGWEDIYISNDYYVPDMLYINNKGKGFVDQIKLRTNQMSFYGMGMDIADINNDGHSDIFVLDMASGDHYRSKTLMRSMNVENFRLLVNGLELPHQYMFNSLQLNNGNGTYKNIAQLSGVSSTDWSWSVLMEDFDFDGFKDIHITNGYRRYALDNDFQKKIFDAQKLHNNKVPLSVKKELYDEMPTEKLSNIFYKNKAELKFELWDMDVQTNPPSYSNGAAIADFDNDGDVDLVINNMDAEAFLYRNRVNEKGDNNYLKIVHPNATTRHMKRVELYSGAKMFVSEPSRVRGYMSSSEPAVFIGLGKETKIDSVKIRLSDDSWLMQTDVSINHILNVDEIQEKSTSTFTPQKNENTTPIFKEVIASNLGLTYVHTENEYDDFAKEILLPYKQSTIGPHLTKSDVDNDGLEDIIISNALGSAVSMFMQTEKGFQQKTIPLENITAEKEIGRMTVADINKDGRKDYLIPAGGNEQAAGSKMYESGIIMSVFDTAYSYQNLLIEHGSTKTIIAIDYDSDGDEDLLVCNRHMPQKYPMHAPSQLLENKDGEFIDVTQSVFPQLRDFGIINDVQVTDLNQDNKPDLVLVGEWTSIGFFENKGKRFEFVNETYNIPNLKGMWFSIASADLNKDGQVDFIVGNTGENSKYAASQEKPLKIYGGDFDENGTWDLVLSKSYNNAYVPLRGLECSSEQMPFIKDKFKTYDMFAKATINDVYGPSLENAYNRFVNTMSSYAILSSGNKNYKLVELPSEAQAFPILDIEIIDLGKDGMLDVILCGNIYDTEVETPRLDAGNGLVLSMNDDFTFRSVTSRQSGLNLNGNIKSSCILYHTGLKKHLLIASQNGAGLKVFSIDN